nr:hypothetical protein [Tanacetum cinerariifolium]
MPIPNVPNEAVYEEWDDGVKRATTTVASLDATQDSDRILALETDLRQTKKVYGTAYTKLFMKVKKLEKTVKSNQARRRTKIVVSDDEEDSEDSSKQGRMIEDIDQDTRITLVTPTKFNTYTRRRRAVSTGSEGVSTASRIFSTAEEPVSTVPGSIPVSTAYVVQEGVKDKGKAIMQESEQTKKIKKRVQIYMSLDEELAQKLYEEEQARFNAEKEAKFNVEQEELLASETTKDKSNPSVTDVDWDNVQAHIQADEELAQKMLEEERESLSITERGKLLAELIDKEKKLQAAQRYEAIRNKPQTMSQQIKTMCTYMKNMARDDLVRFWDLVKERFSTTEPTDDKEKALWVELKRLFEPNNDDILWKLQRYMHDPLVSRLYDTCGVHHVSTERGHDI